MKARFFSGAAALVLAAAAWGQAGPAGHWETSFTANGREIDLSLDLAKNPKSEWIASMGIPSRNLDGLVVSDLAVAGDSVKFLGVELMMTRFDLKLSPEGTLKGSLTGRQGSLPVEFKRTGEARVKTIPPSPSVSKALEGDWEGTLQAGERAFRMIVHFRNREDGTVAATIDTPDTGGAGLPLDAVRQTGPNVAFGVKIAHGSFTGKLNAEGTELAGEFRHEQGSLPLRLRKK